MFVLNDTPVDPNALFPRLERTLSGCASHRYALHLSDTGTLLSTILFLRSKGAGVFPIRADIPADKALTMAKTAGCDRFIAEGLKEHEIPCHAAVEPGVLVQMSSGTTGAPKVIARSWQNIDEEIAAYAAFFVRSAEMTPVIASPINHSYGLIAGAMVALHRGHVPVLIDAVNPKYILRRMREIENPVLYTSPAMLHTLARLLPKDQKLNAVVTSGTVLPDAWFAVIRARTTHFFQQYGCSEVGCIAINQDLQNPAAVGRALPHLRLMAGTASSPAAVQVEKQGRLIATGDLGVLDETGLLTFVSRADDMINVAGLNVYPQDVEAAVMTSDGISDAVAFRVEDGMAGARVGLLYCGHTVTEDDVRQICNARLAPYQQPTLIKQVSNLPREANGKLSRRAIAAQFAPAGASQTQEVPA
ncbi:Long-chain-fatty-acid--CoA ligase [Tritonibacter multivorans]|uniref:Long-chain-fatty-acid--CoA ligase n=1 Tax=Tritonibacter multivorans TaxID=928856 RepID=A0A0P1FZQ5_9RHOB|nr:AMP-binding protein [Tritonibacter multivorans]MDA7422483.1 AMP-binding protein [Tritonibacter multivorans]CUH74856.1 Long-chain-fatty-acid--CoA ligase [Tritonibacter multivorans]SFD42649.1 fatty-acyl-CoA synthase [Tritonibacter multivorans]